MRKPASLPDVGIKPKRRSMSLLRRPSLTREPIPSSSRSFHTWRATSRFTRADYKAALEDLLKANQNDAFIQCMIGQTYEKLGDKEKALEYYRKASTAIAHNPPPRTLYPRKEEARFAGELEFSSHVFRAEIA